MFLKIVFEKILQISQKVPVLECLFNKFAALGGLEVLQIY